MGNTFTVPFLVALIVTVLALYGLRGFVAIKMGDLNDRIATLEAAR